MFELGTKIQSQVQEEMDKSQREYFLRQQLKAIQEELGEADEQQAEIAELRAQVEEANLPEEADKQARRELDRLSKLPPAAAEYGVIRTYLEWILSLPWNETTDDDLDLKAARRILDEDHYDLEKVKERIVEHLAVQKLTNKLSGPILALRRPSRASARRPSGSRSPARSAASSCASRSAACGTRRRSAATGARTSARCPARSSGPSATPARRTRSS